MSLVIIVITMTLPLCLYTYSLYQSRLYEHRRAIGGLVLGLAFDWFGTINMFWRAGKMVWGLHSIFGLLAVSLVSLEMLSGLYGLVRKREKTLLLFRLTTPWIYAIWLASYFTGLLKHAAWK